MSQDLQRPRPPGSLLAMEALMVGTFLAAHEVVEWIETAFLTEGGPLYNPDHAHLLDATIGVLWTNVENVKAQRKILGQAEMPERSLGRLNAWTRARAEQHLRELLNTPATPDFLITLDALHAEQCDDASFCALIDHELYHCAQALDEYGSPKFHRDSGHPIFTLRGHDVEEFVGVVRRFGIEAAGEQATELVIAASQKPEIAPVRVAQACGTCALRLVS